MLIKEVHGDYKMKKKQRNFENAETEGNERKKKKTRDEKK